MTEPYAWCPKCQRNNFGCEHDAINPWRNQADGEYSSETSNETTAKTV